MRPDGNRRVENRMFGLIVDKEHYGALESPDVGVVNDAKVELANVKEAMCAFEERTSEHRFLMLSTLENHNIVQDQLAKTVLKFQIVETALTSDLIRLKNIW